MAYSSGDLILDDHYNIFARGGATGNNHGVANLNSIWGSGSVEKGWGQSGNLSAVSVGTTITAAQWASMLNRMNTVADHQGNTITSITNPTAGSSINAFSALQSNINTLWNNRGDCHASGTDLVETYSSTASWYTNHYPRFRVTFGSYDQLRYFFNAGGMVRFDISRSGGTASSKNTSWTNLLDDIGTIVCTGGALTQTIAGTNYTGTTRIGGSGSANQHDTTSGVYDLTFDDSWDRNYRQFADTYLYTSNYADWYVRGNADGKSLEFAWNLIDDANANTDEVVNGTLTATMRVRPPSTTYISNTWGTPTLLSYSGGAA